jgi:hypothetical protein
MNTKQIIAMWIGVLVFFLLCAQFVDKFDRRIAYLACTLVATVAMVLTLKDRQTPNVASDQA